jgi:hypothetical protein
MNLLYVEIIAFILAAFLVGFMLTWMVTGRRPSAN